MAYSNPDTANAAGQFQAYQTALAACQPFLQLWLTPGNVPPAAPSGDQVRQLLNAINAANAAVNDVLLYILPVLDYYAAPETYATAPANLPVEQDKGTRAKTCLASLNPT